MVKIEGFEANRVPVSAAAPCMRHTYSPFSLLLISLVLFARPMASRWRLRLRRAEPQVRAPARAPAKPHRNTS